MSLNENFPVRMVRRNRDSHYLLPLSGIKLKPFKVIPLDEPMKVYYNSEEGLTDERVFEEWKKKKNIAFRTATAYTVKKEFERSVRGRLDRVAYLNMKGIHEDDAEEERRVIRRNGSS